MVFSHQIVVTKDILFRLSNKLPSFAIRIQNNSNYFPCHIGARIKIHVSWCPPPSVVFKVNVYGLTPILILAIVVYLVLSLEILMVVS